MLWTSRAALGIMITALVPALGLAQGNDMARPVANGGISVPGWTGAVDPKEASSGLTIKDTKLVAEGQNLHVTTGPATTFWNPANVASGNYTVKATFTEPKYMDRTDHPHPYGIVIGGNDMDTSNRTFLYCAAYGDGNFIVRGFGPAPFRMNAHGEEPNAAVHRASAAGTSVTQDIAVSVKGDKVECAINGTVVASYDKSAVVASGKLKSTDGIYGIRFAHDLEGIVSGLTLTKP